MEPQAVGRDIEIAPEQLFQLLQAVQDRVPVQAEGGRGVLDGAFGQIRLQRLQKLFAVADLGIHQRAKAVGDESLGEERVLGQDEVGDDLIVAVDDRLRPELAPCFESLLGLQVGARDAMQAGMVTPDAGSDPSAGLARALRHLLLKVAHELTGGFNVGAGFGRPQNGQSAGVGRQHEAATADLERVGELRQRLAAALTVSIPEDELAHDRDIARRAERCVDGERLALQLKLRIEVVADEGMEEPSVGARATLHVLLACVQVGLRDLRRDLVQGGKDVVGD